MGKKESLVNGPGKPPTNSSILSNEKVNFLQLAKLGLQGISYPDAVRVTYTGTYSL